MRPPAKTVSRAPLKKARRSREFLKLLEPTSDQAVIEQLQHVLAKFHKFPLLIGELGCQFLDALELADKIRTQYRDRIKDVLLKNPDFIPGWRASQTPQRTLSRDTARVFEALSRADESLSSERFLEACFTNLGEVRKLLSEQNPDWSAADTEHELSRILSDLIGYETVVRLARVKDKPRELSLE